MDKELLEYVAAEMLKLQLNIAEIRQYDDRQTIPVTRHLIDFHNNRLIELSNILMENRNGDIRTH